MNDVLLYLGKDLHTAKGYQEINNILAASKCFNQVVVLTNNIKNKEELNILLTKYAGSPELPRVLNGLGIAIVSTSHGVMTSKQAKKENVGGEVLCYVY